MLCRICVVQIQPRKHALDDAGYTAPVGQHELDHPDHTDLHNNVGNDLSECKQINGVGFLYECKDVLGTFFSFFF